LTRFSPSSSNRGRSRYDDLVLYVWRLSNARGRVDETTMTDDDLAKIRKRCEAATPQDSWVLADWVEVIAHYQKDVPLLLDEIEKLRALRTTVRW
jgi:hypothetical protein